MAYYASEIRGFFFLVKHLKKKKLARLLILLEFGGQTQTKEEGESYKKSKRSFRQELFCEVIDAVHIRLQIDR